MASDIEEAIFQLVHQLVGEAVRKHSFTEDVHLHMDESLTMNVHVYVHEVPGTPVRANLVIGAQVPGEINVDTTNETVTLEFRDDKGNVTQPPAGATITFNSDNPTVATVEADANNPLQGDISPLAPGEANIGADVAGAVEPDGSPFSVTAVKVTVSPGPAATGDLVLSV